MYVPAHFAETRVPVLHEAIRAPGLATLVTHRRGRARGEPCADAARRCARALRHPHRAMSRATTRNGTGGDGDSLAIFLGPDAYVSPSFYATKRRTGKVVPTWNYVAIHAYGRVEFFDDEARLRDIVTRLTAAARRPAAPSPGR